MLNRMLPFCWMVLLRGGDGIWPVCHGSCGLPLRLDKYMWQLRQIHVPFIQILIRGGDGIQPLCHGSCGVPLRLDKYIWQLWQIYVTRYTNTYSGRGWVLARLLWILQIVLETHFERKRKRSGLRHTQTSAKSNAFENWNTYWNVRNNTNSNRLTNTS